MAVNVPAEVRTWAEIDLGAIRHNAEAAQRRIGPGAALLGVVKADAYGHGMAEVATALADRVAQFGVANLTEARELQELGLGRDILLLGPCLEAEREDVVAAGYIASVSSAKEAAAFGQWATAERPARINFKVDTGMGRMGCWQDEAGEEIRRIAGRPEIQIEAISTHLPVSDEDAEYTRAELEHFERLAAEMRAAAPRARIHVLNSGGILEFPDHPADLVRVGLMLYGSAYPAKYQDLLRPALTWKARLTLVREVGAGRSISYGRTFVTPRAMAIGTLPVGYADGFPRQTSGRDAHVLVGGRRCAVLGRVTMDQIAVDVSGTGAQAGDQAVLIGEQGGERILAHELADQAGTIAWDIFTGIKQRVRRFYT